MLIAPRRTLLAAMTRAGICAGTRFGTRALKHASVHACMLLCCLTAISCAMAQDSPPAAVPAPISQPLPQPVPPQAPPADQPPLIEPEVCPVDLSLPGQMSDIVSNVLLQVAKRPDADVRAFLDGAETRYASGDELMRAAAKHFGIDEAKMAEEVRLMKHINCDHGIIIGPDGKPERRAELESSRSDAVELTTFARDVAMHVVLHELGHALVREFDLPVLSNEEALADAFATCYLTAHHPDRAPDILAARVRSLMIEASEVPREEWSVRGEHDNDARRAFQIAALAVAADEAKYIHVAALAKMTAVDIRRAKDYGTEVHRSWRRLLVPIMMPDGVPSREAKVTCEVPADSPFYPGYAELIAELEPILRRFDWHTTVTIHFANGDGGASWSRSQRTITVRSSYLRRFVEQGRAAELSPMPVSP
jgi:hypothetical protein